MFPQVLAKADLVLEVVKQWLVPGCLRHDHSQAPHVDAHAVVGIAEKQFWGPVIQSANLDGSLALALLARPVFMATRRPEARCAEIAQDEGFSHIAKALANVLRLDIRMSELMLCQECQRGWSGWTV